MRITTHNIGLAIWRLTCFYETFGQGSLTKEEESALTKYFADKKSKAKRNVEIKQVSKYQQFSTQ